jgi:FkbM family methyltransferase
MVVIRMATVEQDEQLREPLRLPKIAWLAPNERYAAYGAAEAAAAYCGFQTVPGHIRGVWAHGWHPRDMKKLHPSLIVGSRTKPEVYHWVARKDQEDYLRDCGYENVSAIGLPIVYLPPSEIRRCRGSLLVMPVHSVENNTHSWRFDEYAKAIDAIRSEFTEVVVCLHSTCFKRGYWVDAFRDRGFPLVTGAAHWDRNALKRIQYLMSRFEYMTTNGFGSQLAYAAYFGAKPSIYGPYPRYHVEDLKHDSLCAHYPKLIEPMLQAISEEELRRICPQLFCHPRDARADVEWGRLELGENNKVSPRRMRSLFGWTVPARVARALEAKTPPRVKHWARMLSEPVYREQSRETKRLATMPGFQPTTTNLLGRTFEVQDGPRFVENKIAFFDRELYYFASTEDVPRIIDCGASIGLSVCYFKTLYPESEITAFEPDPQIYEMLKRNCESWGAKNVHLIPKAVWNCESALKFSRDRISPGRISERANGEDLLEVQTCRLRDYLTGKIDLLRLNIEGAEVDVLLDCVDLLGQVQNLIVDYHSLSDRPQRVDSLIGLLTKAGFRLHFRAPSLSPSPLLYRTVSNGIDSKLHIFAFRV